MDAMRVIDQTLGNTVPLLEKCNLQVSDRSRRRLVSAAMRRLSMSQTCSIGFRSGEHAGYSIRCIVSASSMFSTRRALCGRALSSWKTKESPMAPPAPVPPYKNTSGVTLQTESGLVCKAALGSNHVVFQSRCSASPSSSGRTVAMVSTECRPLAYVHRALPHEADYVLFGWTPFVL
ncbi:hypothetical protein TNCV_2755611 [Trichonephila clavipes]|nr:hypothetical protein TNCV_2755611 [Trichonephila clavipes]